MNTNNLMLLTIKLKASSLPICSPIHSNESPFDEGVGGAIKTRIRHGGRICRSASSCKYIFTLSLAQKSITHVFVSMRIQTELAFRSDISGGGICIIVFGSSHADSVCVYAELDDGIQCHVAKPSLQH